MLPEFMGHDVSLIPKLTRALSKVAPSTVFSDFSIYYELTSFLGDAYTLPRQNLNIYKPTK